MTVLSLDRASRRRGPGCLSDLQLDRWRVGELAPSRSAQDHLDSCDGCRTRVGALEGQALPQLPQFEPQGVPSLARIHVWRRRALVAAGALAAAAAVAVLPKRGPDLFRSKGGSALTLVVRRASGQSEVVLPHASLAPGDAVRFELTSATPAFVLVLGVDAANQVTAYVSQDGGGVAVPAARDRLLPGSVVLDGTLGPERVVALVCPRDLALDVALAAGRAALARTPGHPEALGPLEVPCAQPAVTIEKR